MEGPTDDRILVETASEKNWKLKVAKIRELILSRICFRFLKRWFCLQRRRLLTIGLYLNLAIHHLHCSKGKSNLSPLRMLPPLPVPSYSISLSHFPMEFSHLGSSDSQRRQFGAMTIASASTSIFVIEMFSGAANTWQKKDHGIIWGSGPLFPTNTIFITQGFTDS